MMKNSLRRLLLLTLAVTASGVATADTASAQANADWWRRQQQQQQQQQRQQELDRQRRQQEAERQRLRDQERQRMRDQERARVQQQERDRLLQQRREAANSNLRGRQPANSNVRRAGGPAAAVSRSGDRVLYSNGVARLNRPPTAGELRRGFTGKVTQDGRALVKVNNRVLAVPAARVGVRWYGAQGAGALQASRLSAAKSASVTAEVQKIARASLKDIVRTGGPGGLSEKFNRAAGGGPPPNGGGGAGRGGGGGNGGGGGGSNDNNRGPGGGRRTPRKPGELSPIFNDAARKKPINKLEKPTLDHTPKNLKPIP